MRRSATSAVPQLAHDGLAHVAHRSNPFTAEPTVKYTSVSPNISVNPTNSNSSNLSQEAKLQLHDAAEPLLLLVSQIFLFRVLPIWILFEL